MTRNGPQPADPPAVERSGARSSGTSRTPRGGLGARRPVLTVVLLAAVTALVVSLLPWAHGTGTEPLLGRTPVVGSGGGLAPAGSAAALAAIAAGVAALLAGPIVRRILGALVGACGVVVAASAAVIVADPAAALSGAGSPAESAPGVGGVGGATSPVGAVVDASLTAWPWVALAAGVVLALVGVVMTLVAGRWPGPTSRYERAGARGARAERPGRVAAARETAWDRLSAGEDPTAGP